MLGNVSKATKPKSDKIAVQYRISEEAAIRIRTESIRRRCSPGDVVTAWAMAITPKASAAK